MGFDGNSKEVDATVVIKEDPTCFDDLRGREAFVRCDNAQKQKANQPLTDAQQVQTGS